ncbi:MAG: hypothetical protein K2I44_05455 [Muribaculaceae bacterium]|nr:hypothetical protein [Muribaculaceae bacterium]
MRCDTNFKSSLISIVSVLFAIVISGCNREHAIEGCSWQDWEWDVVNQQGKLYVNDEGEWCFKLDDEMALPPVFGDWVGSGEKIEYEIVIKNWESRFEEYKDGCIIQGRYVSGIADLHELNEHLILCRIRLYISNIKKFNKEKE